MAEPIFISSLFKEIILPFVLVFTLLFAALQKSELLGKDRKQNDAIVSVVIALILIAFPFARDIVVELMPFLAVSIVVIFVFMLVYGFVGGKEGKVEMHKSIRIIFMILFALALITVLLFITGAWDYVFDFLFAGDVGKQVLINSILIVLIAGTIIAVIFGAKGNQNSS